MSILKKWAEKLNGREYREELSEDEGVEAAIDGVVIVFCHSDDLIELRGFVFDEIGAFGGGEFVFGCESSRIPLMEAHPASSKLDGVTLPLKIKAEWCPEDKPDLSWRVSVDKEHEPFLIMEDGRPFCEGVVFTLR